MEVYIHLSCVQCGSRRHLEVEQRGYDDWRAGTLIQDALPDLDADEREWLISGYCPECWDSLVSPEEA